MPKEERRNRSCVFRNTEPNLEAFQGDRRITDDALHFPPGAELVFRCKDIGKYSLVGSVRRRCVYGDWDGVKPSCFGLSQENDYAREWNRGFGYRNLWTLLYKTLVQRRRRALL